MTVYIEYVLIDNFLIDYMLISLTLCILNVPIKRWRIIISSIFASAIALVFPLITSFKLIVGILKLLTGYLIVTIATPKIEGKKLYAIYLVFLAFTFALGGILIGIYSIFSLDYNNELFVSLAFLPCYVIIRFIKSLLIHFNQHKNIQNYLCEVEIASNEKVLRLKGLLDSGNGAYNKNSPVIFIARKKAMEFFIDINFYKSLQKIKIYTVNGEKEKIGFIIDEIKIYFLDKVNIFNNVTACIIKDISSYDVILHNSMIKGGEDESDKYTFKAS